MGLKEIFDIKDKLLLERLQYLMPKIMMELDIQMYIVMGDEYNEGPTVKSLLPSSFFNARKKSIFIFTLIDGNYRKMIVSKPDFTIANFYEPVLLKPKNFDFETFYSTFVSSYNLEDIRKMPAESEPDCIKRIISQANPKNIAIDFSSLSPFADGLTKTNYDYIVDSMDDKYRERVISGEKISLRWLETRVKEEWEVYKEIIKKTRQIIKKCYSREVITPNVTTIGEARFFLMEEAMKNFAIPWFNATIWIRRKNNAHIEDDQAIIKEGDLLHCDYGFEQYGLCSDVQEMAYVKAENDEALIKELEAVHNKAMIVQNCLAESFVAGRTGNEILNAALNKSREKGIEKVMIYSHPIGLFGHGPGPTIGTFGNQGFNAGMGEYVLHNDTAYAMELNVKELIKGFNAITIMYGQEIDVAFINGKVEFIGGRQEKLHII